MEETNEIDETWRRLAHGRPNWWTDHPIFRAAYEHPALRALFPFPSHGSLSFYQTAWPPYPARGPERLAFIVCDGPPYNVYTLGFDHPVGAAGTAEEAVMLLVASVIDSASPDSTH